MIAVHKVPESDYVLGAAEREGLPAVVALNLAYANAQPCPDCSWLLSITMEIVEQSDAALPTDDEAVVLNDAEDAIEASLAEFTPLHHVARQTWNGQRIIDYYVQFGAEARARVETLAADQVIPRRVAVTLERDPEWNSWLPLLTSFA